MKELVRSHFEDFVNNRKSVVIHKNMTADFYDHNVCEDVEHQQEVQAEGGACMENPRMPVLELIVNKNMISGFKGTSFFRPWPLSGRIEDCPNEAANRFGKLIEDQPSGVCLTFFRETIAVPNRSLGFRSHPVGHSSTSSGTGLPGFQFAFARSGVDTRYGVS